MQKKIIKEHKNPIYIQSRRWKSERQGKIYKHRRLFSIDSIYMCERKLRAEMHIESERIAEHANKNIVPHVELTLKLH